MRSLQLGALLGFLLLIPQFAIAQTTDVEEVLSGFDDSPGTEESIESGFDDLATGETEAGTKKPSWWSLDGFARLDATYAYDHEAPERGLTDHRGLAKLRTILQLEVPLTFGASWKGFVSGQVFKDWAYTLRDREKYTDQVLDQYESEAEWKEIWLGGSLSSAMDLKLGRQIVVWGKSDLVRVNDVLNPVDSREPGLVDIEDVRLPVTMTRLDFFLGDWNLTTVAIHEIRFDKIPVYGSDYFPFSGPMPPAEIPEHGGENTEFGLALNGTFSGWDMGFYYARLFEDFPHLASVSGVPDPRLCMQPGGCALRHSELTHTGLALAMVFDAWLFKMEAAQVSGLEYFNLPGKTKSRTDLLAGVEYAGWTDQALTLEMVNRHLNDMEPAMEQFPDQVSEDVFQTAFSYRADLLRQTMDVTLVAIIYGSSGDEGGIYRGSVGYDLAEALTVSGGVVNYQGGSSPGSTLTAFEKNDRIFTTLKYDF